MSVPSVSVLIIAHNRAHTIGAAVRSVLNQTVTDLELVVVDDGSSDRTSTVVQGFTDPRVRLITSPTNQGIPRARNLALGEAKGGYVAWLDSDDLCHPQRLEVQRAYLDRHSDVAMLGSAARKVDLQDRLLTGGRVPVRSHEQIRALLLFRSAFQQSSIFGRSEALREVLYDPAFPVCEDVDMFARFTDRYRAENLPLFLIARRIHSGQTIRSNVDLILDRQMKISAGLLQRLDFAFDEEELRNHVILGGCFEGRITNALIDWAEGWFERIYAANAKATIYEEAALRACFDHVLLKAALRRFQRQPRQWTRFVRRLAKHPRGALKLSRDFSLPLLPFTGQPSAAGLKPLLKT